MSAFVVPVAALAMVLGIVVASFWARVRTREMLAQERLAAIARGLPLPPTAEEALAQGLRPLTSFQRQRDTSRRVGLVLLFAGVGLVAFFVVLELVLQVRPVLSGAAAGLIPAMIGVGFLADARARTRDLESGGPAMRGDGGLGMGPAAEARPLH